MDGSSGTTLPNLNDRNEFVDTRPEFKVGIPGLEMLDDLLIRPLIIAGDGGIEVLPFAPFGRTLSELIMAFRAIPGSATGGVGGAIIPIIPLIPPPGEMAGLAEAGGDMTPLPLRPSSCARSPSSDAPRLWERPPPLLGPPYGNIEALSFRDGDRLEPRLDGGLGGIAEGVMRCA